MADQDPGPTPLDLLDFIFYLATIAVIVYGLMSIGSYGPELPYTTSQPQHLETQ